MKKIFSLIKASMTEGMNLFKISTKKQNVFTKIGLPCIVIFILISTMYSYCEVIILELQSTSMQFVLLTLFVMATSVMTLIEGIYKSSGLLFNCRDDDLLLSLPIKRRTVLFTRIFKFYVFELMYNSIFLLPAIIVYAVHVNPSFTYYIVSIIAVILLPVIPILISCIIGTLITYISSKFKKKSFIQTIITVIFLLVILYFSYNSQNLVTNISKNAISINSIITKLYYPAKAYTELVKSFNALKLIEFIFVNIALFVITVMFVGAVYFNINSNYKIVKSKKVNKKYKVKTTIPAVALMKKEINRFFNSPVFITNAGFGLILFVLGCVLIVVKFDSVATLVKSNFQDISLDLFTLRMPVILFAFICVSSFMTSITSSMISLEGKSINILKSLPITPYKIVKSKILAAILLMIPCMLIGSTVIFIRFKFDYISIILTILAAILLPLISETIGIIVNLKYPKMDATNDTEVVKQSMSSFISVVIGMGLSGITVALLLKLVLSNMKNNTIMIIFNSVFLIFYLILLGVLHRTCDKNFEEISV